MFLIDTDEYLIVVLSTSMTS